MAWHEDKDEPTTTTTYTHVGLNNVGIYALILTLKSNFLSQLRQINQIKNKKKNKENVFKSTKSTQ